MVKFNWINLVASVCCVIIINIGYAIQYDPEVVGAMHYLGILLGGGVVGVVVFNLLPFVEVE